MEIVIRYRLDMSETFETDFNKYHVETWEDVIAKVKEIEGCNCTVLSIDRYID